MKKLLIFFISISLFSQGLKITYEPIEGVPIFPSKIKPVRSEEILKPMRIPVHKDKTPFVFNKIYGKPFLYSGFEGSKQSYDTLYYWNTSAEDFFYWDQPDEYGDINYSVRFTPLHNGTLKSAIFWFYHLVGSGNIRIHIWNDNGGYPGTEIGYVDFPTSGIQPWPYGTIIDLSSLGISVSTTADFYIGYSLLSGVNTLGLVYDTVGLAPERCYDYWSTYGNWETSDWIHSNITWLIEAVVEYGGTTTQPNLTYYTPSGWDGPIVPSSVAGTHTIGPNLQGDSTTYIDWAIINNGSDTALATFYIYLYSDGTPIAGWYTDSLPPNYYAYVEDYAYTFSSGTHTLKIFADSTNTIAESNESDNIYSQGFTWGGGGGGGVLGARYIIITSSSFVPYFEPLAWWKTKKGVPAKIVTTDYIYANYSGSDNQQKIRNFIIAQRDSGAKYILLGGQGDQEHGEGIVPRRDVWCMQSGGGVYPDEDTIPCDMYYSNLDGTWNGDGDNVYGEMGDNVDLYSDITVGRAPVKNTSQVQNFVNKILTYEKNPPTGYIKKILLPSVKLFDYYYHGVNYYGYVVNNAISNITPSGWQDSKLEDNNVSQTWNLRQAVIDSLNNGFHFCHHADHGDEYGHYYLGGNTVYNYSDADAMTNGTKYSIINAISCFTGAIDEASSSASYDCVAEHYVNRVSNGAVATMMNTRYGLGYPPDMGPSEVLDTTFYHLLFSEGYYHLGEAFAESKDRWASSAQSDEGFRWSVYELTLFGDPEMPIWTDTPQNMSISINLDSLLVNQDNNLQITVQTAKSPISGALVCIATKDYDVYDTLLTNSSGIASFTVHPSKEETIFITVTKHNYIPQENYRLAKNSVGINEEIIEPFLELSTGINKPIKIRYFIPDKDDVSISVVDILGRNSVLFKGIKEKGIYEITYRPEKSGIYFIKLKLKEKEIIKKAVFF
uniref:T9SS type A sorting domain-containing protein n=1 Tax=candidate division WOR-3 bacterium TaxID=2052148 RepID=A0A7C4YII1_UNCW3